MSLLYSWRPISSFMLWPRVKFLYTIVETWGLHVHYSQPKRTSCILCSKTVTFLYTIFNFWDFIYIIVKVYAFCLYYGRPLRSSFILLSTSEVFLYTGANIRYLSLYSSRTVSVAYYGRPLDIFLYTVVEFWRISL